MGDLEEAKIKDDEGKKRKKEKSLERGGERKKQEVGREGKIKGKGERELLNEIR